MVAARLRVLLVVALAAVAVGLDAAQEADLEHGDGEGQMSPEELQMMLDGIREAEESGELAALDAEAGNDEEEEEETSEHPELTSIDKAEQWQKFQDAGLLGESSGEEEESDGHDGKGRMVDDAKTLADEKAFMEKIAALAEKNMTAEELAIAGAAENKTELLPPKKAAMLLQKQTKASLRDEEKEDVEEDAAEEGSADKEDEKEEAAGNTDAKEENEGQPNTVDDAKTVDEEKAFMKKIADMVDSNMTDKERAGAADAENTTILLPPKTKAKKAEKAKTP